MRQKQRPEKEPAETVIKEIRRERGLDLAQAEAVALGMPHWRRWVEARVNSDEQCRKMALRHIRDRGDTALLKQDGGVVRVR